MGIGASKDGCGAHESKSSRQCAHDLSDCRLMQRNAFRHMHKHSVACAQQEGTRWRDVERGPPPQRVGQRCMASELLLSSLSAQRRVSA